MKNRRTAPRPPRSSRPGWTLPAWALPATAGLGLLVPALMLIVARTAGIPFSFPVDDAWIHLQYARNLAEHGAFAFFPGDPTTAGSTAPLFTLLETPLWLVSRSEVLTGLALGLAAQALFLFTLARWAARRLGSPGWAAFAVAMVALDGRFALLALSGMETSLFLAGIAFAFLAWTRDDARAAALALGLTVWVRPEALVLAGVFAIDALIARRAPRHALAGLAVLAALVAAYAGFNLATGHAAFPNTLAAKAAYYRDNTLAQFLENDVRPTFGGGWLVLALLAAGLAVVELRRRAAGSRTGEERSMLAELGWALALVLAYAVVLRFSHRFHRYLVPALPAIAVAGTMGLARLAAWGAPGKGPGGGGGHALATGAVMVALALQLVALLPTLREYGEISKYHLDRHVRAGRWLAEHTPEDAVIATHDVGAIAFYSRRRILDVVGLVTPEVVPHLNRPDYLDYLERLFDERKVTHLAVLDSWQPVDNQAPLYVAHPDPEVLRVYAWRPGVTHLLSFPVAEAIAASSAAMQAGDAAGASRALAGALRADSSSATAWTLAGAIADREGRYAEAGVAYARAVALFRDSPEARTGYVVSLARLGRLAEARAHLDTLRTLGGRPEAIALVEGMLEAAEREAR